MPKPKAKKTAGKVAGSYVHPSETVPMRPEIGTQANFRKKKAPRTYRYDSSLSPALEWDGANGRAVGEWLIGVIERAAALPAPHAFARPEEFKDAGGETVLQVSSLQEAVDALKRLGEPFLNWAGKAERLSFDVPTLPLFVHERLSTQKIVQTLIGHKSDKQADLFDLFGDPQRSIVDQTLHAYEYPDKWVNRLVLGDSLVVMNSLLHYEKLGGQVQMIYIDPPYGVKFGSNFQPFVRKRDVSHNDDGDLTREPEMVKAYRDTWELGLHSYLTYMRDRLLLARDLLAPPGSVFVQISDENLHHVRELLDEIFGAENFAADIAFVTTTSQTSGAIASVADHLLWYGKNRDELKYRQLFIEKEERATGGWAFNSMELPDGTRRSLTTEERQGLARLPEGARPYTLDNLTSQGATPTGTVEFSFEGRRFYPGQRSHWKTTVEGMNRLAAVGRIEASTNQIRYVRFANDFAVQPLANVWTDSTQAGFVDTKIYAVQTLSKVVQRCILMTTDPGDLVLDPTCGSGTTAYVAEQWGRRWITIDTSRVPLALTRQRLLTATYDYYRLQDAERGPGGGFVYGIRLAGARV